MPETLDRLLADLPTGDAPIAALLDRGHTARRRRRRLVTGAVAGLTAVVVVGAALLAQVVDLGDQPPPADPPAEVVVPTPPDGMKYVGLGRVAVAVPEEWEYSQFDCVADTYGPGDPIDGVCADLVGDEQSSIRLVMGSPERPDRGRWSERVVGGERARDYSGGCVEPGVERCMSTTWIPALNVMLQMETQAADADLHVHDELRESIIVLPEGVAAVPFPSLDGADYGAALQDAGLVPAPTYRECPPGGTCLGPVVDDPVPGALVTEGTTVSYTSYDPPPDTEGTVPEAPAGMKYVGLGRIAVAIPEDWEYESSDCPRRGLNTYGVDPEEVDPCADLPPAGTWGPSWVRLRSGVEAQPSLTTEWIDREVVGLEIRESDRFCVDTYPEQCSAAVWVPELEISIALEVDGTDGGADTIERIQHSLIVLPEGVAVVPAPKAAASTDDYGAALQDAGLVPAPTYRNCRPAADCADVPIDVDPEPGALMAEGSTVSYWTYAEPPAGGAELPEPPEGKQYVGLGGVLFAVPDAWVERDGCGDLEEATTYGPPTTARRECVPVDPVDGTYVQFSLSSDLENAGFEVGRAGVVDGYRVRFSRVTCFSGLPGCAQLVEVRELDVLVSVRASSRPRATLRELLDSLVIRP